MRLLDRYQLRELLGAFAYCLAGILVFWLSFELLGGMDELRRRDLVFGEVLLYLWHRLPLNLLLQIPVALLLSMLYVLTQHAKHNELVAMRAAGMSPWRIGVPYLVVGMMVSLGLMAVNEYAVPDAAARAEAVLERHAGPGSEAEARWRTNLNFRDEESGRIWWLQRFHLDTGEIEGLHVQWPGEGGAREELIAESGRYASGAWTFEGVTRLHFPPANQGDILQIKTNVLSVTDFPETPAHLRSEVKISRMLGSLKRSRQVQLSLREILDYRELHRTLSPEFDLRLRTWFHDRLASPWTCLVVVLIALPAGAGSGRRNAMVGVAAAILMAFAYFVVKEFSLALGTGGFVAPWLAAWTPNLVFSGIGVVGILRSR